ncbi:MAG: hypothetical protein ACI8UZ_000778 [Akkermansiaceae bacterium]|jgi:hypothetical protein
MRMISPKFLPLPAFAAYGREIPGKASSVCESKEQGMSAENLVNRVGGGIHYWISRKFGPIITVMEQDHSL